MFVNEYLSFCHFYAKAIAKRGKVTTWCVLWSLCLLCTLCYLEYMNNFSNNMELHRITYKLHAINLHMRSSLFAAKHSWTTLYVSKPSFKTGDICKWTCGGLSTNKKKKNLHRMIIQIIIFQYIWRWAYAAVSGSGGGGFNLMYFFPK